MAVVHIENLAPGMVLSEDVCDRSGRMLLPAGAELTGKHFSIFRMWGVLEAEIVGDTLAGDAQAMPGQELDPALFARPGTMWSDCSYTTTRTTRP